MNKKNLILGGVLLVLLILAFAYKGPFKEYESKKNKNENFLASIDVEKINKIEIAGPVIKKVLVKNEDKWQEEGAKGNLLDVQKLDLALNALKQAKDDDLTLISEVKEKQGDFEISDDKATKITLKNGEQTIKEFRVGKNTSDFSGSYVSEIASDKTYAVNANFTSLFGGDWYDKTIFKADKDIKKIRFQFPSREFTVEKSNDEKGEWTGTLPYKFPVSQEKMEEIVRTMTDLIATEIPEQKFEGTGLEKNSMIVEASGDGFSRILMVGDANKEGLYYAKRGDSDNIYLIKKEEKDILEKRISDLK